jgi:cholesterol oxidase
MSTGERFDVVVVGSGFGGSVTAYRLAKAGWRVCVLERGKAYGPGDFARRPREMAANFWDPSKGLQGLFDVWSFRKVEALVASGLGGGSLIYANMLIRKDENWFVNDSPFNGGYERWPISRADLDSHYDAVEEMLGADLLPLGAPGYPDVPKSRAMAAAAAGRNLDWNLRPMAVTFANAGSPPVPGEPITGGPYPNLHGRTRTTCRLCGECCIGCNYGSKNTLDHTYLSAAKHEGADIRTRCEVRGIVAQDKGFTVEYVEHLDENEGQRTNTGKLPKKEISADRVVLAAGALGSPYLLLRNQKTKTLPPLGPALGTRFSGNGDLLGFLFRARPQPDRPFIDASKGPVITGAIRVPDAVDGGEGRGYYVEDAGYPVAVDWLAETASVGATVKRFARFAGHRFWARVAREPRSRIGADLAALIGDGQLSGNSLPLLGMGRDVPDGLMSLRKEWLDVHWNMSTSKDYFRAVEKTMAEVAGELGARFRRNPLSRFHRVITVHPLGGCPMGSNQDEGVVDVWGEAFGCPGLFVLDGSTMPGPVGPNPSLTIAAFADRAAEHLIDRRPTGPVRHVTAVQGIGGEAVEKTSLQFTEEMKGYVALGETDPQRGHEEGRRAGTALQFHLDMHIDDVDRFADDRNHTARAQGWIDCEALGGRLIVDEGEFNLFVDTGDKEITRMFYRLPTKDGSGNPVTLMGVKYVEDDPGLDLWSDTSTLFVRILAGHVDSQPDQEPTGDVVAAGILRIPLTDFLHLLSTFRAHGANPLAGSLRFGKLFLGRLWDVYGRFAGGEA